MVDLDGSDGKMQGGLKRNLDGFAEAPALRL
jgi:hypothetical protein